MTKSTKRNKAIADTTIATPQGWSPEMAKEFFLRTSSYCTIPIPQYFNFATVIEDFTQSLGGKPLMGPWLSEAGRCDKINYSLRYSLDSMGSWNTLELINPAIYASLVNWITMREHWALIKSRFDCFAEDPRIECGSPTVAALRGNQNWCASKFSGQEWFEMKSLQLSLEYEEMLCAKIADIDGSFFHDSIIRALHNSGLPDKFSRCQPGLGIGIMKHLSFMRGGGVFGIPSGSALMDLFRELVLGFADHFLLRSVDRELETNDYGFQILRFQDRYRIFVNGTHDGENLLDLLAGALSSMGLRLAPADAILTSDVALHAIEEGKLEWLKRSESRSPLDELLCILDLSHRHGDSALLFRALVGLRHRLEGDRLEADPAAQIAVLAKIMRDNPRALPVAASILSHLLHNLSSDAERYQAFCKVWLYCVRAEHCGLLELWLQRISLGFGWDHCYQEKLSWCAFSEGNSLWNCNWMRPDQQSRIENHTIVDEKRLAALPRIIQLDEVDGDLIGWNCR